MVSVKFFSLTIKNVTVRRKVKAFSKAFGKMRLRILSDNFQKIRIKPYRKLMFLDLYLVLNGNSAHV